MSDLAYDTNGNPIRPKPEARKWLLKRIRPKAPPQVMFRNGQRVTLPINAGVQHLRQIVNEPGRYRLVALDELDEPVEDMPEAYVELDAEPMPPAAFVAQPPDPMAATRAALAASPIELLLMETVRANTELARTAIERVPDFMRAGAYLIQTADGAGLPRRPPMRLEPIEDDDDDDEYDDDGHDDAPPAQPSLLEVFLRSAMTNGGGLSGLAKLLGAGAASPTDLPPTAPSSTAATEPSTTPPANVRNAATPPPPDPQAHLLLILSQLSADERAYAERVFVQLSPEAVRQWHELLLSMSVEDAVKMIRAKAAGQEA